MKLSSTLLWCVCHATIPSFTVDLSKAEYLTPAVDSEVCYDASGDGEHCICGYNPSDGNAGCCTGTLQIDMGDGITGNFDYIGWDTQFNKPYYRTKIESKWYVLFYSQNYGDFTLCDTVTPGTGLWMIQQSFEIPTCVAMHINKSPVLPIVSEAPCPNGLVFTTGGTATVCSSSPVCDACKYGSCFSFAAAPGGACGDIANNLVCGSVCCECGPDREDADGDPTNGCEAETTLTIQNTDPIGGECGFRPKDERTCPDFTTCILTNQNFESVRTVWDLSTVNAGPNMLEDKHELKCAQGFHGPTNGNLDFETGDGTVQNLVNVTCLCTEANGCEWTFSTPGYECIEISNSFDDLCPISDIQWIGDVGNVARVPFATHSDGTDVSTLNTDAIVNKNGAFVKSQFKPGKFADPTSLSNGMVLFLVYPFKLSSKRTNIEPAKAEIELRLYAGDDSKQLAILEDNDSTLISVQIVNGIADTITTGQFTHFWFTLNGVNMSPEEHGSFRLGAMAKDAYDAILADGTTSAGTDLEYAGCLISRVSKIPPFYFPQTPTVEKWLTIDPIF